MNLREKLGRSRAGKDTKRKALYETYGFMANPFPPASQPMGHRHQETSADDKIFRKLQEFQESNTTQAIVIEGTQGTGKTNLLEYYEKELENAFSDEGYYIIRYYPDPEPGFESVLRKIIQAFGEAHFQSLIASYNRLPPSKRKEALLVVRNHEMRNALGRLMALGGGSEAQHEGIDLFFNWLLGLRVLKRHHELLGIKFRLDTVEAQTQALRDLIYFSSNLGVLNAIFLLLDELEKQDYALSKLTVLRYLSAIRALIDALPQNLFAVLAMTPDAKLRYFGMLPALAGRLQSVATLKPLQSGEEALALYAFYVEVAREAAAAEAEAAAWLQGAEEVLGRGRVLGTFEDLKAAAGKIGEEGVKQRAFLDALHNLTAKVLAGGA